MLKSITLTKSPSSSTPLLSDSSTSSTSDDDSSTNSFRYAIQDLNFKVSLSKLPIYCSQPYKSLAVLSGHTGSVSCLSLCGEFILSASQGKDIIVWQCPDLRQFTKFGQGDGSVKALVTAGNRVLTAHQDSRIRVWKVSRRSENMFRLLDTLPTTKDYLGKFMKQSNYVQTRRHHKLLWIEHADSISCLAVSDGLIYSGSWDKSLKVWRMSDFKCLESIKAHDDAINSLVVINGIVYSASADGKIKIWGRRNVDYNNNRAHSLMAILEGHKDISLNSVVVTEDGSFVYGGGSDGCVMGWLGNREFDRWSMICEVKAHNMAMLCMCLTGEFLCTGSADKTIGIWKREINGGLFKHMVIKGHEGPVKCLQASSTRVGDGFMLHSGSMDKSLRVWWVPNYFAHYQRTDVQMKLINRRKTLEPMN